MKDQRFRSFAVLLVLFAFVVTPLAALGQTVIKMPKNKYKVADDIKFGDDAARQVEQQFPILNDQEATRYVAQVGERLVDAIPPQFRQPAFDYRFKIVNASDINAFALPGGPMFVDRGMIEAARNEGEMAGVMAHEISHVALRHATAQATKQGSVGNQLGVLGMILGGAILGGQTGAQLGAIGATAWMTKYSREYETQADTLGAQIMARAGYDPRDLANMFETIEAEGGSRTPQWLSSHPDPGNRYEKINREASTLRIEPSRYDTSREFLRVKERLSRLPKAPTMAQIEQGSRTGSSTGAGPTAGGTYSNSVPAPSRSTRLYQGIATVSVPSNWRAFESRDTVQFAPEGAWGDSGITRGALLGAVNGSGNLSSDTQAYVDQILQGNSYLRRTSGYSTASVGGTRGLSIALAGRSPITGQIENATVYTAYGRNGTFLYLVTVVPEAEAYRYTSAFQTMVRSLGTR